jgi:hypothetical protein
MTNDIRQPLSKPVFVLLTIVVPIVSALLLTTIVSRQVVFGDRQPSLAALQFAGIGLASWLIGWRVAGLRQLGLRFGRPLSAGAGFAFLALIVFLVIRLATVVGDEGNNGVPFLYLLLFESYCTQLWTFGLFFHAVADWRGPLTAAVSSGLLFGATGLLLFQEVYAITASTIIFFAVWGILYGIIRLRTGTFLGVVFVQSLQSWLTWQLFNVDQPDVSQMHTFYLITSPLFVLYIWRLWPKKEEDYRI